MTRLLYRSIAPAAGILILCGCASERRPAPPPSAEVRISPPRTPPPESMDAATFVENSGSIDLLIIRSSELALQRSASPRVRDFATTMIRDHKGTSAQLSFAGRRVNALPSAILHAHQQAMLDQLLAAPDFDPAYIRLQRAAHQDALTIERAYARTGASPTLRPVAADAIPIEERHLRLLAYL